MSGPFEKYVEQAALALHRERFGPDVPWGEFGPVMEEMERAEVRAALAAVGPLIQEDARERMVAAAGAALEREGVGCGCGQAHDQSVEQLQDAADRWSAQANRWDIGPAEQRGTPGQVAVARASAREIRCWVTHVRDAKQLLDAPEVQP